MYFRLPSFYLAMFLLVFTSICGPESLMARAAEIDRRPPRFEQFTLSAGSTYFDYEEPGVMSEEGILHGLNANYIHGNRGGLGVEGSAELWAGSLDYDGSTFGGDPVTASTEDSITTLEIKAGRFFSDPSGVVFPYLGVGYRLWDDVIESTPQSLETEREIEYMYMPVGIRVFPNTGGPWYFKGRAELQALLSGDVTFQNRFNMSQDSGLGLNLELNLERQLRYTGKLGLELFAQYWDIAQSDFSDETLVIDGRAFSLVEPENTTTMIGLRATVSY